VSAISLLDPELSAILANIGVAVDEVQMTFHLLG
jgi:hypothetical protein